MRGDGLPSSLTLIGPAGADGYLAGLAAEIQARSGVPMGATGLAVPPPAPMRAVPPSGRIALAVVGAHPGRDAKGIFFASIQDSELCRADSHRIFQYVLEYRL